MWTDRFVKLPIEIVKYGNVNLGTKQQVVSKGFYNVLPTEVCGYRKHYSSETNAYDFTTLVELKHRGNIIVELPIEEFEQLMNLFS